MDASLLLTKLFIPSVPPNIIHRPQLIERLTAGLQAGKLLTVVSAPAGYGKSTMLAQWITAYHGQVAWLSLDDRDNHPLRFWRYFVAALQTVSSALGQTALPLLEDAQDLDVQRFLTALVNDVAVRNQTLILILDDYHVISNADIHAAMKTLLEHALPSLHLVIATRTDPPLPLSRLRVRGHMTEVRLADLRFSTDEATGFLNGLMNLALRATDVQALEIRTEGWIAGLQLAALSLQDRADVHTFIQAFTGSQHLVLEYLVEEVLSRQPASLQQFLLETAILQRMCAPLCNAVTEATQSDHVLSDLQRRNLFLIPLDSEHYWFRYHHLFAEFLKSHLKRTRADEVPVLHRRAAEWFQANGYPEEALHHAFAIPDYAFVSRLVVDNWRRIYHTGRLSTAVRWLESLPGDLLRQSPPLGVAYGWTLFIRGDYEQIGAYLDDITQAFERMVAVGTLPVDHPEYSIILHQVILLRAVVMRHQGDVAAAIQAIEQLLATVAGLRQALGQIVVEMGYTACYSQLGYAYAAANDRERAAEYLSRVSSHARACGNFFALAHATMEWATICLAQGQIEQAEKICRYELSLAEQPAYAAYPAFCLIQLALADVLRAKGAWDEAETLLAQGLETARRNGHQYYLAHGYLIAARLHHAQGNPTQAQDAVHQAEEIALKIRNRFLDAALAETQTAVASTALPGQPLIEPLTERELDVLRLICAGKSNQEIADELFLALNTVKRHVNNLYGKLGVSRRAQAIIEARRLALV
ncbi:LuxR C-terminal-related transcriptional regulator [Candidatus Chloroploca mongolica]|uniref:LuxR C-terminal-related transcriptional regulator n=1 Tax=Candidatus Chloroploca mongolica TaxID=2528176 RepID=UPI001082255B|nr:LuxR C-terminal-related transcriptional regulator [Candidatus Chloroploca mongolica]